MDSTNELWLPIPEYERLFQVSNQGRVRKLCPWCGEGHAKLLSPFNQGGYLAIQLTACGNRKKRFLIHTIVASAFIGPKPPSADVNHIDGNKRHNAVCNLEYLSRSDNLKHAFRTGLRKTKLTPEDVIAIRSQFGIVPKNELARRYGISYQTIKQIARRNIWNHI